MDPVVKEVFKFAFAAMEGTDYVSEVDLNDQTNYLPTWDEDYKDGGQVFMNRIKY